MPLPVNPRLYRSEPMHRCKLGECQAACCLYGVWMDPVEVQDVRDHLDLILPHMPPEHTDPAVWWDERQEADEHAISGRVLHSAVVDSDWHYGGTACIFLRRDYKCALQVASEAGGFHPWRFKPFYCILHPLDLDDEGRITLDETPTLLDEPASCLRPAQEKIPLVQTFEPELRYLLGEEGYTDLVRKTKKE